MEVTLGQISLLVEILKYMSFQKNKQEDQMGKLENQ